MRDVWKLGFILFAICAVAAGSLAVVNDITEERIASQAAVRLEQALRAVVPEAEEFKDETDRVLSSVGSQAGDGGSKASVVGTVYIGYKNGEVAGVAFACAPSGYGGPIDAVVGVSRDGVVTGLTVVKHSETPGLGANITSKDFQERFLGLRAGATVKVTRDGGQVQAITGATISSRAVASAVDQALRVFEAASREGVW
ncbi:MAG: RnfABCDGE type electron transport complex subunit G [Firmicutes bacterium]|nr:RnfABCDGE type electron transport complex subunit G [Bacillota bacterium]MDH7494968.1 RnfABCDGE type electron transport complex subunit G [Bacillota bacterium]